MVNTPSSSPSFSLSRGSALPSLGKATLALSILLGQSGCDPKKNTDEIAVAATDGVVVDKPKSEPTAPVEQVNSNEELRLTKGRMAAFKDRVMGNEERVEASFDQYVAEKKIEKSKEKIQNINESSTTNELLPEELKVIEDFFNDDKVAYIVNLEIIRAITSWTLRNPDMEISMKGTDKVSVQIKYDATKLHSSTPQKFGVQFEFAKSGYVSGSAVAVEYEEGEEFLYKKDEELAKRVDDRLEKLLSDPIPKAVVPKNEIEQSLETRE